MESSVLVCVGMVLEVLVSDVLVCMMELVVVVVNVSDGLVHSVVLE